MVKLKNNWLPTVAIIIMPSPIVCTVLHPSASWDIIWYGWSLGRSCFGSLWYNSLLQVTKYYIVKVLKVIIRRIWINTKEHDGSMARSARLLPLDYGSLLRFNSPLTNPRSKSRAHRCVLNFFISLSISLKRSCCFWASSHCFPRPLVLSLRDDSKC